MRKIKEILRLHREKEFSTRQIGRCCNLSPSTVIDYLARAKVAGLSWPLPENLDDTALEALLFPENKQLSRYSDQEIDFARIHQELSHKGVTLQLLWIEYKQEHGDRGYQYSRFCELYQKWRQMTDTVLRQTYKAGEKLFVDYAGPTIPVVDPNTGEIWPAHIFVAVLGASNYTYAEPTRSLDLYSWVSSHCRAFEFFGGIPDMVIPDNTRTAVKRPCWYDPEINETYQEMAAHFGTVIVPARPRKPRDYHEDFVIPKKRSIPVSFLPFFAKYSG
jgi:transposase